MRPTPVSPLSPPRERSGLLNLPLNLFFFSVAVLLYTPLLVMFLSRNAGNFTLGSLAPPVLLCFAALVVPGVLRWRWRRTIGAIDALLAAPLVYVLITTTFFPVHGNVLDGTETVVARSDRLLHDGLMLACVAAALVPYATIRGALQRLGTLLGLFVVAASMYMAITVLPLHAASLDDQRSVAALGPRQNVIVLMLDMLEGGFGSDYFRRHPDAENDFDGFAFYRNASSFAPFTALSYSGFMSGGYPGADQIQNGSIRDTIYYKQNIVDDMVEKGYATSYFSIIPYEYTNAKVVRVPGDIGLPRKSDFLVSALTMRGRYVPYAYLPFGIRYMPWTQREFGMFSKTDARDSFNWFLENLAVDRRIDKGFVWFHTLTTHQPVRFDADGRFSMGLTPDDAPGEVSYVFGRMREFMRRLQQLGVYDDALVIILSDHGYNILRRMKEMPAGESYAMAPFGNGITIGQYEPLFIVKKPGAHGRMIYADTAVSLLDVRKTLAEFASPGSGAGLGGFNFLGTDSGSPNRTVPVIRFVGTAFDSTRDFTSLENWRTDSLRLPFGPNYSRLVGVSPSAGLSAEVASASSRSTSRRGD
jgi:hypothetical protein